MFLTGVGGIFYPLDALNINENSLKIIKEKLTGDDIALQYFEVIKGIEVKWVSNKHLQGLNTTTITNLDHQLLYEINKINNDIYIKNINIDIKNIILENFCVNFKTYPQD